MSWVKRISEMVVRAINLLRSNTYDTATPHGRGRERLRLVAWSTISGGMARAATMATVIVSVAITPEYLGKERFGMWMTITSVMLLLNFADLGMSNSIVNAVSEARGRDDDELIRRIISNGFFFLAGISAVLLLILFSVFPFIDWAHFFNVQSPVARADAATSTAIFLGIFLVNTPISIVQRLQTGLQEGWRANIWQVVGQLISMIGIIATVHFDGGLPWLVISASGGPAIAMAINYADHMLRLRPEHLPKLSLVDLRSCRSLIGISFYFFVLQFMAVVGNASDNIVIAQILGASAVAAFAVAQRLAQAFAVAALFIAPLWPAFGEALARGDHVWARKALTSALLVTAAMGVVEGVLIYRYGGNIINAWAGSAQVPTTLVMGGFSAYMILISIGGTLSAFLNNGHYLKQQVVVYSMASLSVLGLKIYLTSRWLDPAGAIWATVIGYTCIFLVPALYIAYRNNPILIQSRTA